MVEASLRAGPGRPSTGARERLLRACVEVLKGDGYARLTTAKVAQRSGDSKALIAYHFGSKQGMVAEAARAVSAAITAELLEGLGKPDTVDELVRGLVDGFWGLMRRDQRLLRAYFDLASQSVVEPEAREILRAMKQEHRRVLIELLRRLDDGPVADELDAAAVYLIAVLEGLSLERLGQGESAALARARRIFTCSAATAIGAGAGGSRTRLTASSQMASD